MDMINKLRNNSGKKSHPRIIYNVSEKYLPSSERNKFSLLEIKINKNVITRELINNKRYLVNNIKRTMFNFLKGKLQT